jgi:hypothetical protein
MALLMTINAVVVTANALLLAALIVLYARMLGSVPSRLTWGLLLFAVVLFVENVVQLYFFATMMPLYAGGVEGIILAQNALVLLAVVFLGWVTFFPMARSRNPAAHA